MARRSTTSSILAAGGRLPVLVLRRDPTDSVLIEQHLERSNRLDVQVVRPADLVRTPLRWPADPRIVPLAVCVLFRDRPGSIAAASRSELVMIFSGNSGRCRLRSVAATACSS